MAYWFRMDMDLVKGNTRSISMTFSDAEGDPIVISAWTFYYKATNITDSTVTITVADGSMTKSNSGRGVVDTVSIPLDNSVTVVAAGRYTQEIAVKISGEPTTIALGTLNVTERVITVT
jgi:hypothetical protein